MIDRRRHRQPRRADPLLHRRGPRQHRAARRRDAARRRRGDGRVPLLRRPRARRRLAGAAARRCRRRAFLLMSATLGDTRLFEERLTTLTGARGRHGDVSASARCRSTSSTARRRCTRPSRRSSTRARRPSTSSTSPSAERAEQAQNLSSLRLLHARRRRRPSARRIGDFALRQPLRQGVQRFLRHGIGLHHAGLLPKYRVLVEQLAQQGLLKVICGTDTLGVGVNIPIRTVLFTQLCKFDGEKTGHPDRARLPADRRPRRPQGLRRPRQRRRRRRRSTSSRTCGSSEKAARDGKKKSSKRKPPEKGYVHWDQSTFERLHRRAARAARCRASRSRTACCSTCSARASGDGCRAMLRLIRDSPRARRRAKRAHRRRARQLLPRARRAPASSSRAARGRHEAPTVRVNVDLQDDFSLDQALSLYLLETLPLLDRESPTTRSTC